MHDAADGCWIQMKQSLSMADKKAHIKYFLIVGGSLRKLARHCICVYMCVWIYKGKK